MKFDSLFNNISRKSNFEYETKPTVEKDILIIFIMTSKPNRSDVIKIKENYLESLCFGHYFQVITQKIYANKRNDRYKFHRHMCDSKYEKGRSVAGAIKRTNLLHLVDY